MVWIADNWFTDLSVDAGVSNKKTFKHSRITNNFFITFNSKYVACCILVYSLVKVIAYALDKNALLKLYDY